MRLSIAPPENGSYKISFTPQLTLVLNGTIVGTNRRTGLRHRTEVFQRFSITPRLCGNILIEIYGLLARPSATLSSVNTHASFKTV